MKDYSLMFMLIDELIDTVSEIEDEVLINIKPPVN